MHLQDRGTRSTYPLGVSTRISVREPLRYQSRVCGACATNKQEKRKRDRTSRKKRVAGRGEYSGSERKERESKRQVHHGDTPSIILVREKDGKGW